MTYNIFPNVGIEGLSLGTSFEQVKIDIHKLFDVNLTHDEESNGYEITEFLTVIFNQKNVLSQIIIYDSSEFTFNGIKLGDKFEKVSSSFELFDPDIEEGVYEVSDFKGLWLEFNLDWKLDAFIIFDEELCKLDSE